VERGGAVDSASGLAVIAGTFLSGGSGACTVVGEYLARGHPGAKATGPTQSPSQTGPPGQNVNSAAREVEAETGDGGAETGSSVIALPLLENVTLSGSACPQ